MKDSKNYVKIMLIVFLISSNILSLTVLADTNAGSRTLNSSKFIEIYPSGMDSTYRSLFSSAVEQWSYVSSNMKGHWILNSETTNCDIAYTSTTSTSGLLGITSYYKKILGIQFNANKDEDWIYTRLYVYTNQMDAYNMTPEQKTANFAHELGHTQKLTHPSTTQISIMNQGIQNISVTTYDKNEIKNKWGN